MIGAEAEKGALCTSAVIVGVEAVGVRSSSATGPAVELCLSVGPELHPPLPGPKGESGGAAGAADGAGREGLALGRGVLCSAELRAPDPVPLATPLSNSSIGSSRCA